VQIAFFVRFVKLTCKNKKLMLVNKKHLFWQ